MIKNAIIIVLNIVLWTACTYNSLDEQPIDEDCSSSSLSFATIPENANCGQSDGSIEIIATGGVPPYKYAIDDGALQAEALFSNLQAGNYLITVIENQTCTKTLDVTVGNVDGVEASATVTSSGCNTSNGTISVQATNGTEPYQYQLVGSASQSSSQFAGLTSGEYEVLVTDASGCDFSIIKSISTGISYDASVKPIIMNNCAISGCHDGSTNRTNFTIFSNVQNSASSIKSRTQSGNMPRNGSLTQTEKDAIACWVDDGALGN